ncbi:MAG: c-type cytochrome [Candidatus Dadabacteria bacterium]|nr:c-type cytochrome [Candidatus Dadabacteria bacterium]NIY21218.1 c-type cytochrome [Candidatus Dadabacteria bacterium]
MLIFSGCAKPEDQASMDPVATKGKQLVSEGNCSYCHTPLKEENGEDVPDMDRYLSGHPESRPVPELPDFPIDSDQWLEYLTKLDSTVWAGGWGVTLSANITPDKETGIGAWTEEMFIETMRQGRHKGYGRNLQPPMPWQDYGKLSDEQLKSIFAYLKSIKPVSNNVPRQ